MALCYICQHDTFSYTEFHSRASYPSSPPLCCSSRSFSLLFRSGCDQLTSAACPGFSLQIMTQSSGQRGRLAYQEAAAVWMRWRRYSCSQTVMDDKMDWCVLSEFWLLCVRVRSRAAFVEKITSHECFSVPSMFCCLSSLLSINRHVSLTLSG